MIKVFLFHSGNSEGMMKKIFKFVAIKSSNLAECKLSKASIENL